MSRTRRTKNKSLEVHTKRRSLERFGFLPSKRQYLEMSKCCFGGGYFCLLEKQSLSRKKVVIYFNDEYIPVIYDSNRKLIVTVLSLSMLSPSEMEKLQIAIDAKKNIQTTPSPGVSA